MPANLLDLVKGYLTSDVVDRAASYVGESSTATRTALDGIVAAILAALSNLGSTGAGVQQIARMIDTGGYDGSALANLGNMVGGGAQTQDALAAGRGMMESLFGDKLGGVTDLIARSSGVRAASAASLMALAGPIVMHVLARQRAAAGGGVAALTSLLESSKGVLAGLLPAGLASLMGWSGLMSGVSAAAGATASAVGGVSSAAAAFAPRPSDWLIPIGAIVAVLLMALSLLWSEPGGRAMREARIKLTELQLPGGLKISVPEGAFNFSLASWLAGSDTTLPKRFVFDNLNFESATTKLTPESRPTVDSLVVILKAYPPVVVGLEGHTDSTGDPVANKKLSLDRAVAVKDLLVAGGVADTRVNTAGLGAEKPIAPNDTEEGRAKNRRLELVVEKR